MKGTYASNVGGDFIPTGENVDTGTDTEGTAKITSSENEFDLWKNINENLTMLMDQEKTVKVDTEEPAATAKAPVDNKQKGEQTKQAAATQRRSNEDPYFFIDRSLGLVTVVAPLRLQNIIKHYFDNLNKEIYRQVAIEAKIVEVYLKDNSKIGIDWATIFEGLNINGILGFGNPAAAVADGVVAGTIGQVYPQSKYNTGYNGHKAGDHVPFLSKVTLSDVGFNMVLNALNEQGDAKVLSNPKLTTMNGHPAVLSVFKNKTYIKQIEVTTDDDTGDDTYSVTPGTVSSGVALGILPSIVDDETVILHLTPITTDLMNGEIPERVFGRNNSMVIGLPEVNVREMSTMVKVKNGEMLIIGGLIDSAEGSAGKFAPIVGDIPVIKYLFGVEEKRMEKRELVILLTPRVL
jgi:general secretion pathway protein D/MSHA biogenesis protein MshL